MAARILITGASGFVGPYLHRALAARFPDATLIGLRSKRAASRAPSGAGSGDARAIDSRGVDSRDVDLRDVDLLDGAAIAAMIGEVRPDAVVHLAGQASVTRAQAGQDTTWLVNVAGTLNLALAVARHASNAVLLFASSSEIYGDRCSGDPIAETAAPSPLNPYARSKAIAEKILADVLPPEARLIVARPFNHTGAGQGEAFALPSFARQIARIEADRQEALIRVGNLDVARDFLDVRDVADAYVALIAAASRLPMRFIVNVASGQPRRLRDLLDAMHGMARRPFSIAIDPGRLRPVDVPVACGDAALLRRTTGWAPGVPIERTLADLLDAARVTEARSG